MQSSKSNLNRKHPFLCLFFLFIIMFPFSGCKKDVAENIIQNVTNPQIEEFLRLPDNSVIELKIVIDDFRKQLSTKNFVDDFIQWHGKPDWEKAIKIKTYDSSVVLLIPTFKDNEILAFIGVKYINGNFKYELHRKSSIVNKRKEYSYVGFDENINKWVLNYFDQNPAKYKSDNSTFENIAPPPFCWYILLRVSCNLQKNNSGSSTNINPTSPCYGWFEQCSDDDGNGGSGGGGGGGGGCTTCNPPECPQEVWYNIVPDNPCENIPLSPTVIYLNNLLTLNPERIAWLNSHQYEASVMKQMLDSNWILIEGDDVFTVDPNAKIATWVTIDAMMANYINGPYNAAHYNHIKHNIPGYENHQNFDPIFWVHFRVQCALTRLEHPEWSSIKIYWEVSKELIHTGLDVIGLVPVISEVADLANGIIYTIQGDGVNATLSFASMIPVAGWFAVGIKYAKRADGLKFLVREADNIIEFGGYNSTKFRKALGLPVGDPRQAHHLIPRANNILEHRVVQKAAKAITNAGFHIDEILNGVAVAAWRNQPNHPNYNDRIIERLNSIPDNLSANETYNRLQNLMQEIRTLVINNPSVHLNNLVF